MMQKKHPFRLSYPTTFTTATSFYLPRGVFLLRTGRLWFGALQFIDHAAGGNLDQSGQIQIRIAISVDLGLGS
jgi:hypothetical protein